MQKVEYIIVGAGYAGLFFAHQLLKDGISFKIYNGISPAASQVSAGIINPVVLKRFTTFWKAQEQIDALRLTMEEIGAYLGKNYLIEEPIFRIFHDENEKITWQKKCKTQELCPFLDENHHNVEINGKAYAAGKVLQSARLDVSRFFADFINYLGDNNFLVKENFDYSRLLKNSYQNVEFENIVFCEGMGVLDNPFFKNIPIETNKGHHFLLKFPENTFANATLKKRHFLFPTPDGYYYGGTYDRESKTHHTDESAVESLKKGLKELYSGDYTIEKVNFGFRPTVPDRRPIVSQHSDYDNYFVFNGLGARGVLNGAYFSKILLEFIEKGVPLPPEVDLERFAL